FEIDGLLKKGIMSVYITEGEEDDSEVEISPQAQQVIEKNLVPDKRKMELSKEVKERVGQGIQYLFDNTTDENFAQSSENVAGELMNSIMSSDAVAFDINMLKVSDEYTFKHSVDVAAMAMIIGKNMGMPHDELKRLGEAGLLHDIGKSSIPDEILNKKDKLTDEEFTFIKQHSVFGFKILTERGGFSDDVLRGVLQHHEKMNGRGYPKGTPGEHIHKFARIISVADVYDALVTDRPYKKGFSKGAAVEMIMAMSEELDLDVMKIFLSTVVAYPVNSIVTLVNGEKAKVVQNYVGYPLRPKVVSVTSGKVYDLSNDIACASLLIDEQKKGVSKRD
ncbi:MAG: HD-GYP domain-containing protein, partial [Lachnospiraceae bacterium]|nr:HD-GYP domain-containing protein [Lachnospiraceae bacterium]